MLILLLADDGHEFLDIRRKEVLNLAHLGILTIERWEDDTSDAMTQIEEVGFNEMRIINETLMNHLVTKKPLNYILDGNT